MEFLRLLLRRRFARAQVATSRDAGCFLGLPGMMSHEYDEVLNLELGRASIIAYNYTVIVHELT